MAAFTGAPSSFRIVPLFAPDTEDTGAVVDVGIVKMLIDFVALDTMSIFWGSRSELQHGNADARRKAGRPQDSLQADVLVDAAS